MAIKPPNYQKDAIPTKGGWRHPKTNELLVSTKHTQAQIDEYNGVVNPEPVVEVEQTTNEILQDYVDFVPDHKEVVENLKSMTKAQLEELGREKHGVELDRRRKKEDLILELTVLETSEKDPNAEQPLAEDDEA